MSKQSFTLAAAFAALSVLAGGAATAATAYNTSAAFDAATAGVNLTLQSFESAPLAGSTATSLNFGNVTFSCVGTTYCPGFFGRSTFNVTDGQYDVFYATPDTAVFSFAAPIKYFGVDVIGMGDVGVTTFSIDDGTGPIALESNYSVCCYTQAVTFGGIIDSAGFQTVTFTGTQPNDGIFFDRLRFAAGGVPEPTAWALMLIGLGSLGGALRQSRRRATPIS